MHNDRTYDNNKEISYTDVAHFIRPSKEKTFSFGPVRFYWTSNLPSVERPPIKCISEVRPRAKCDLFIQTSHPPFLNFYGRPKSEKFGLNF